MRDVSGRLRGCPKIDGYDFGFCKEIDIKGVSKNGGGKAAPGRLNNDLKTQFQNGWREEERGE